MTPHPAARRSPEEQARLEAALTELFEQRITFNQVLGLKVESMRAGDVRLRFAMRPDLIGHYAHGRLHGGVISSVLDVVGAMALMAEVGEKHAQDDTAHVMQRFGKMGTIDLRVDFLRQGLGRHFVARGEVTRLGGRVGSAQMRLVNDEGTLLATGSAAYIMA